MTSDLNSTYSEVKDRIIMKGPETSDKGKSFKIVCKEAKYGKSSHHYIATSWRKLQEFFVRSLKDKSPNTNAHKQCKQATDYINCWSTLGYSYLKLKQIITENDLVNKGNNEFQINQWNRLNKIRKILPKHVSLSFLIDKTLEYFRMTTKINPNYTKARMSACTKMKLSTNIIIEKPVEPTIQDRLNRQSKLIDLGLRLSQHCSEKETSAALQELDKVLNEPSH